MWKQYYSKFATFQVVDRGQSVRAEAREQRIRSYFYGPKKELHPHTFELKYSELKVYKIGAPSLPASCMPLGMKAEDNLTKVVPVEPGEFVTFQYDWVIYDPLQVSLLINKFRRNLSNRAIISLRNYELPCGIALKFWVFMTSKNNSESVQF